MFIKKILCWTRFPKDGRKQCTVIVIDSESDKEMERAGLQRCKEQWKNIEEETPGCVTGFHYNNYWFCEHN